MKTAIVHDWLITYAGAERVLEQIIKVLPDADLFSLIDFIHPWERGFLQGKSTQTSFIQKLPLAKKQYRSYLPLMPLAVEQLDLSQYELVISNSHAVAKGVITGPNQLHISYVHSPMRYAWDLQHQYLRESSLEKGLRGWLAKAVLHYMRLWDCRTVNGVDYFAANSRFIAQRVWKVYRRQAAIIYPPVDVEKFTPSSEKEDFYVTASRMVPYKKIDLIVEAFKQMPDKKLIVIGDGPDYSKIRARAGKNVEFLGFQPTDVLKNYMQKARAFVFAAEEDFGITPVEAQACGTPVIALGRGGVLETVKGLECDKPTGVFFPSQTVESLVEAVRIFEANEVRLKADYCRKNALRFSSERFRQEFRSFVIDKIEKFKKV